MGGGLTSSTGGAAGSRTFALVRQVAGAQPGLAASRGALGGSLMIVGLPLLVLSVPGILIIVLVSIQVAGTALWIPIVRRFRQPRRFLGPGALSRIGPTRRARLGAWIRRNKR